MDLGHPINQCAQAPRQEEAQHHQQQLTIFYNGSLCVCDVTELQARAILLFARRKMEEHNAATTNSRSISPTTNLPPQLCSPTAAFSMKRSLQRFLQKRKHRSMCASSYHRPY